jgi:hypothetical protein
MRPTVADLAQAPRRVDRNALRTNQAAVVLLIVAAFDLTVRVIALTATGFTLHTIWHCAFNNRQAMLQ